MSSSSLNFSKYFCQIVLKILSLYSIQPPWRPCIAKKSWKSFNSYWNKNKTQLNYHRFFDDTRYAYVGIWCPCVRCPHISRSIRFTHFYDLSLILHVSLILVLVFYMLTWHLIGELIIALTGLVTISLYVLIFGLQVFLVKFANFPLFIWKNIGIYYFKFKCNKSVLTCNHVWHWIFMNYDQLIL